MKNSNQKQNLKTIETVDVRAVTGGGTGAFGFMPSDGSSSPANRFGQGGQGGFSGMFIA